VTVKHYSTGRIGVDKWSQKNEQKLITTEWPHTKRGIKRFVYLPTAVRPTTKLEIASLIIKRKPCNVYLACALKDAWRDVKAAPVVSDDHVCLKRAVELLVRAVGKREQRSKQKCRARNQGDQMGRIFATLSGCLLWPVLLNYRSSPKVGFGF
jgi:hypothetical protein